MRPDWLPDWTGKTVVVVASGPSAAEQPLHLAADRLDCRFIATKRSIDLCPWAEILYAMDYAWWHQNDGCLWYRGTKMTINNRAAAEPWGINLLRCSFGTRGIEFDDIGRIAFGGNSGFNALNIAAQTGTKKIILVGFDMRIDLGQRWHPPHTPESVDPDRHTVAVWKNRLDAASDSFVSRGIRVVNSSGSSALANYDKMPFSEALDTLPCVRRSGI